MGQRHCRVYANLRSAELIGVHDANPTLGQSIARQYDVPYFPAIEELLAAARAVSIAAPTLDHFDLSRRCLARGVHILVEKPIAQTLEQARQLTALAEAGPSILQVGHIERFNPAYLELRNALEDQQLLAVEFRRLSPSEGSNTDVDVVLDLMIHDANLVLDLMGRLPDAIEARGLSVFSGTIDHVVALLSYQNGPLFTLTASRVTETKVRVINVTTREAFLQCDLLNKNVQLHRQTTHAYVSQNRRSLKYRQESVVERIQVPFFEPLFLQLEHFLDCVCDGTQPLVSARDGWQALELAEAIRQAALPQLVQLQSQGTQ
jgi:predicted dehydrogenase